MHSSFDVSSAHRLNYTRYVKCIYSLCPSIMQQAFKWLYLGGSTSLKELYEKDPSKFHNISGGDLKAIKDGKKLEELDVTLLYKLLQRVCNLAESNDPIWYKKPEEGKLKSFEYVFHQLKVVRNDLSHPDPLDFMKISDEKLDEYLVNLQILLEEVLVLSAKRGNVSDENLGSAISKMKADIRRERNSEDAVSDEEFLKMCKTELKNRSPNFSETYSSYVIPRLKVESIKETSKTFAEDTDHGGKGIPDQNKPLECSLTQILDCQTEERKIPRMILICGDAGSGKSSMCQYMTKSWLENSITVSRLQEFELILPIRCSEIHTRDLQYLLRSSIIPESSATLDVVGLMKSLKKRKTLWVLDGWDEATREANGLITRLISSLEDLFPSHTILITTRPHAASNLPQKVNNAAMISVSLLGLNDPQREEFLRKKANTGSGFPREVSVDTFVEFITSLEERAAEDCRNPLKLELMLKLWQENPDELKSDFSFTKLYLVIIQILKKRLLAKLEKDLSPAENNAEEYVTNWLSMLYKVAFESIFEGRGLILNDESIKTLRTGFDPVIASHCLSTFLFCPTQQFELVENTRYAFLHSTQRCVYAALHIANSLSEATDADSNIDKLFQQNLSKYEFGSELDLCLGAYDVFDQCTIVFKHLSSKLLNGEVWPHMQFISLMYTVERVFKKSFDLMTGIYSKQKESILNLDSFYSVFICVLEMQSLKSSFSQLPVKSFAKLLHLSLQESGSPSRWFEVIRKCNYNEALLQEAKYYIDSSEWIVKDCDLKAAWELLSYILPERITIVISGDPMKLLDLDVLLFILSKQKIEVHLSLRKHLTSCCSEDLSNKFMDILCDHNSKCKLTAFEGHLDFKCLQNLSRASKLKHLKLRTMDEIFVKYLCLPLNKLEKLESVLLVHDLKSYPVPEMHLKEQQRAAGRFKVFLSAPHMHETDIESAVEFIANFCLNYDRLHVGPLQAEKISKLFELRSKNVTVANIVHDQYFEIIGNYVTVTTGYIHKNVSINIRYPSGLNGTYNVRKKQGYKNKLKRKTKKKVKRGDK